MGKRLTKFLAPIIVGVPLFFGSCAHTNLEDMFGTMLEIGAMVSPTATPKEAFGGLVVGRVLRQEGERKYQQEEADRQINATQISYKTQERKENKKAFLIVYNEWKDTNRDGSISGDELLGLGKEVFDLDKEMMVVQLGSTGYEGNVYFRSWSEIGELIEETKLYVKRNKLEGRMTGPGVGTSLPSDFLDKLKESGPGNYKITAETDDGEEYVLNLKILRSDSNKESNTGLESNQSVNNSSKELSSEKWNNQFDFGIKPFE